MDEEILKALACPECTSDLKFSEKKQVLTCSDCREEFKVEDGIAKLMP